MGFDGEIVVLKPPRSQPESRGGAHCVAHAAVSDIKSQTEAKFHMYYLISR
jgi:hypothetical protein